MILKFIFDFEKFLPIKQWVVEFIFLKEETKFKTEYFKSNISDNVYA